MKWLLKLYRIQGCILVCLLWGVLGELGNPYKILGVHRKANIQEIRKVYKQLAKELHPDKNDDPKAHDKFIEIKQAYELLSDTERRKRFDDKGITEDDFYKRPEYPSFHTSSPFDEFFTQHNSHFNFQDNDIIFFHKLSISTRQYDKVIVPKSKHTPHLIFFYADFCFSCIKTAPYCRKLVEYLEPLGINFVTVHAERELNLGRRLSIHTLPCLVLLLDGNVYVYKETITSVQKIVEFIRHHMPYKLVPRIKDNEIDSFLNGWEDNRVRGLIFEPRQNMRLRYLVTAYHFRNRVAFGFIDSNEIRTKYQVPHDKDTVLLFNENSTLPMASISMTDIPTPALHNIISSNQYLALPRLSSQGILEALCPCEWSKFKKRLCVVLVTEASSDHDSHRQSFRYYAQQSPYSAEKVRFAYIYHDKQSEFVNSLIPEGSFVEPLLRIVILWRKDANHVKFEWLTEKWGTEDNINYTTQKLESTIKKFLKTTEALSYEALVKDLFDEHSKGIFTRIITKIMYFIESIYEGLSRDQILPAVSILGTIIFILVVGYLMSYLVKVEEENIKKQKAHLKSGNDNNNTSKDYSPELKLHELRSETYNGLVRLLKPGCRTIVLVLDVKSRQQLIPPFHKAVWPFRKNKTLMFAYMYIERGLSWYKDLLQLSLPEERELNINPRNCVGTVLSITGHRKYFCMFHAKHTEGKKSRKRATKNIKTINERDCESGSFIGFNSDTSSEDEILLEGNLLDGLPNWLDRLFEGSCQRYQINYWPDFSIK